MAGGRNNTIPVFSPAGPVRTRPARRGAAALTEALLSVTILTVALGVLGKQFNAGAKMARRAELHNQAMVLAEMKMVLRKYLGNGTSRQAST